jgi:HAD superfamily hydrolase (TIGR01509 family)
MPKPRAIFFDVGNTLLFPNRAKMLAPIATDLHPTLGQWQAIERRTKREFDEEVQSGRVNHGFWWNFHTYLLEDLGVDIAVREALVKNAQNSALWDQILPGTREVLERIAENFRIGVISNADGRVDRTLSRCGIADCFESITDSGNVGVEKPRAEIFAAALRTMDARPEESLYVGDVYSVDYLGARNAAMDAVLLDIAGTYRDRELPRVESLEELESWLEQ